MEGGMARGRRKSGRGSEVWKGFKDGRGSGEGEEIKMEKGVGR